MYRQIRGWRHDYRNHIQTMKAYAASGDLDAIKNYLDLLDEDLTTVDTVIKTGNPMTDAILNSKISLAKSKGIAYEEHPALYFLYQFYRRKKAEKNGRTF
jgi:UDP-N-acetylglucosamine 2-epimerase